MCGIAGLIDPSLSRDDRAAIVGRMCTAMVHRGPDDQGIESRDPATLGVRRLAIFDPANGHQPMHSPDGRFTLVFNGAIYNFRELRAELEPSGWAFRTQCDTEVLLASWARWGQQCLGRLRGMFALALWDAQEATLHLARDPFGIKPLYYRQDGDRLLFASEVNALRASGVFASEIDPASVSEYLGWLAVPAPRTIFRGVFSLRPGEAAAYRQGRFEIRPAWNFRSIPHGEKPCSSRREFIRELRARLDDTTQAHMLADVPVGAFLSGGLDSAVICGLMTRATGGNLQTFSIGFEDGPRSEALYSEASAAEATARHLGAQHHTHILTGAEVAGDIGKFLDACDQPTGDGLNTYYASQAAHAGGVKVALSGLGGDELFGGYPSSRHVPRIAGLLPWWLALPKWTRRAIVGRLRRGGTRQRKLGDFLSHARNTHEVAAMQRRVFSEQGRRSLLSRSVLDRLDERSPFHPELSALKLDLAEAGIFELVSGWELRTYMADVLLRDSDVMSMRHSLELRVPFVDRVLIEWLWRQPAAYKFTPGHPKSVLAEAAADLLPPGMKNRAKQGFTLPLSRWMRHELKPFLEETFANASVDRSGLFNRPTVQSAWQGFLQNNDAPEWTRIWSLGVLIAFINRAGSQPAPGAEVGGRACVEVGGRRLEAGGSSSAGLPPPTSPLPPPTSASARPPPSPLPPPPSAPTAPLKGSTLLMVPEIFTLYGGIARVVQCYLKALCELSDEYRHGVRLLSLNDAALDSRDSRRYTGGKLNDWFVCNGKKRRFVKEALRMSRVCDRIVCGHVAQLPVAWLARRLNPNLRYYLIAHGIEVWRSFSLPERLALRGATRIFCVSDFTRQELLKHCPLPQERTLVIPNVLDTTAFAIANGRPLAECPPVILTISRLTYADRYKGVEHLIAAMPAIRAAQPEAQLRIIGKGDDLPRLQALARGHGLLGTAVHFLGPKDDKSVVAELRACRLFALPSGREGFGIVFLEAMASGRPCLGARAGGTPEVINEESGVLVEFGNVPAIANGCIAALRFPWREERILAQAGRFSFEAFKWRLGNELYQ